MLPLLLLILLVIGATFATWTAAPQSFAPDNDGRNLAALANVSETLDARRGSSAAALLLRLHVAAKPSQDCSIPSHEYRGSYGINRARHGNC